MGCPSTVIECWDYVNECLLIRFLKKHSQLKSGSVMVCLKGKSIFEHYELWLGFFKYKEKIYSLVNILYSWGVDKSGHL
jgi:hypothetical protein